MQDLLRILAGVLRIYLLCAGALFTALEPEGPALRSVDARTAEIIEGCGEAGAAK